MILAALTGFLALTACRPAETPTEVTGEGYEGVIFPAAMGEAFEGAAGLQYEGYWTPTAEQVAQLEAALPAFLGQSPPPQAPNLGARLGDYQRQYIGVVEGGQRLVYANFFCNNLDSDWQREFVFVNDGGDCFFQALWNPADGSFPRLSVNGEA